ncbi:MAG: putative metalloprotease CJM1_0395 family protein [Congregibacter sp.]
MISGAALNGGFPITVAPVSYSIAPVNADLEPQSAASDDSLSRDDAQSGSANTENDNLKPGNQRTDREGSTRDVVNGLEQEEIKLVRELAARDREVRAHEQAHANVGGRYAGSPTYSFQKGPDGRQYAVGGEVSIDVSPVPGDPQATIDKARIVRRAALAPAQPSSQDRAVAAEATAIQQQASAELLAQIAEARSAEGSAERIGASGEVGASGETGETGETGESGEVGANRDAGDGRDGRDGRESGGRSEERSTASGMYYQPIDAWA